ncbi:MAG: hypothetical protein RBT81_13345 [Gammaproteobacteria bacterium]|jgi:hypothetical protein|nr:hypothetical protein [Gammaproteobacteria bacterium]
MSQPEVPPPISPHSPASPTQDQGKVKAVLGIVAILVIGAFVRVIVKAALESPRESSRPAPASRVEIPNTGISLVAPCTPSPFTPKYPEGQDPASLGINAASFTCTYRKLQVGVMFMSSIANEPLSLDGAANGAIANLESFIVRIGGTPLTHSMMSIVRQNLSGRQWSGSFRGDGTEGVYRGLALGTYTKIWTLYVLHPAGDKALTDAATQCIESFAVTQ